MARVTVEDCVTKVPNRFELVMLAAQRARNIGAGALLTVDRDNDKNPVVALREIAGDTIDLKALENNLVRGLQKIVETDEPEGDEIDLLAVQREISAEQATAEPVGEMDESEFHLVEEDADEASDEDRHARPTEGSLYDNDISESPEEQ